MGADGELFSDTFEKTECLRKQYESVYTRPDDDFKIDDPDEFFEVRGSVDESDTPLLEDDYSGSVGESDTTPVEASCYDCIAELVHECQEDRQNTLFAEGDSEELFRRRNPSTPEKNDVFFDFKDVLDAIKKMPNGASCGPDGVPPCLLKRGSTSIALMLTNILKQSFESGEIPDILKLGLITPVHKGGSTSNPANFRPVLLTSHITKTGERIVREQLVAHLEHINKMDSCQHGSRRGRSTLSQLLEHHDEIITMLENDMNVDSMYLDFFKAFDKCDFGIHMHKLKKLGIKGKLGRWLLNFLSNIKQQVMINGMKSNVTNVT